MATSTFTTVPTTTDSTRRDATSRPALWRVGAVSSIVAAAATTAVAALARAADIPLAVDGESIPLAGFAQLTLIAGVLGIALAALARRFARHARRTFVAVTVTLTAASLVPDLAIDATTGSKLVLMLTHVVAAAVIIPCLARRLDA